MFIYRCCVWLYMSATSEVEYWKELISSLKKNKLDKNKLSQLKNQLSKKYKIKRIPTDTEILMSIPVKDIAKLKSVLSIKPTRTLSGVSVVAVMSRPQECPHGACAMCPSNVSSGVPQSYTGKEPATRRAIRNNFDSYLQVFNRLEQYVATGHNFDKVELIIMGGTFPSFHFGYQKSFVMYALKAMNDFSSKFVRKGVVNYKKFKEFFELPGDVDSASRVASIRAKILSLKGRSTLLKEQVRNEKAFVRCIGMTVETRSDYGKLKHGNRMLELGVTRVELGIQSVYNDALQKINRGHTAEDNIQSIRELRDLGFKLNFHYMPGLPGVNRKKDFDGLVSLFSNSDYRPDMLKLYPCMVMPGTKLYKWWKTGKYKPITTEDAAKLIAKFKKYVPEYVRIMRVQRDIPTFMTTAGVDKTNLRQYVHAEMYKGGIKCRCIRCRQPRGKVSGRVSISVKEYDASHGKEFFISAEVNDCVLGFVRLRLPSQTLRKEITKDSALIRELHVYGTAAKIGGSGKVQHKGIGSRLMARAEKIALSYGKDKMVVISGIGVKEYYIKKLGYKKEGVYVVKGL